MQFSKEQLIYIASSLGNMDVDFMKQLAWGMVANHAEVMAEISESSDIHTLPNTKDTKEHVKEYLSDMFPEILTKLKEEIDACPINVKYSWSVDVKME